MEQTYKTLAAFGIGILFIGFIFFGGRISIDPPKYSLSKKEIMNIYCSGFDHGFNSAQDVVTLEKSNTDSVVLGFTGYYAARTKDSLEIQKKLFHEK